ncbi:uncharacterized protein LOC141643358 [Silene latifolia]|uniref:uncharacterized protein LOC141643358 n=1 Tax=Silene latifolia TaxID=37657 RepID=UPI003D7854D6
METPSSTRRTTRSHTKTILSNTTKSSSKKVEESAKNGAKKSKQRTCLFDITNDSPIIGLASGNLSETPVSTANPKRSSRCKKTTGSGEALLRSQVKTLLQKVEEEAEISKFLSFDVVSSRHSLRPFLNSPISLLAPTPNNTPLLFSFNSAIDGFETVKSVLESSVEDQLAESKVVNQKSENGSESEKDIITRSLFLDFSEKSASSPSKEEDDNDDGDDDDESVWSMQVNVSTHDEDENVSQTDENVWQIDELCEGIKKISVKEEMEMMGKHIRFVYNSDDELVEEEVEGDVLRLKGLPTPKGKHLRFQDEDDD